jgi:putative ABC transport system permease protein
MRRKIALRILIHERSTTLGSILGVVAIIFLVGQQLAILFGLTNLMAALVENSPADAWICSPSTDNINATGSIPIRYADRIMGLPEIADAQPIISAGGVVLRPDGKYEPVQLVGLARPELVGGPWRFARGGINALLDFEGLTIDILDRQTLGDPELGSVIEISGKKVRVAGMTKNVRGFQGTLVFTNMNKAREISQLPLDRCSNILVRFKPGQNTPANIARLKSILRQAEVVPVRKLADQTRLYYLTKTGIGTSFGFSTIIGVLVGFIIIALTMYTNILNRQKDFAVLRALGARKKDILIIVFFQALFIALAGILAGFFLLALFLGGTRDTRLPSIMYSWAPPIHALLTIFLCLLGSLMAMRRAVKIEPASAFR